VNLIGFVVYYLYPAAPPWYVELQGFAFIQDTPGNVAGLGRFDALTGTSIFSSMYAKSSNVFAAVPSLHSAYPVLLLYAGWKYRMGWLNLAFVAIAVGIWFAAVYSSHHYVVDVLLGIACAISGLWVFNRLLRLRAMHRFLTRYEKVIS